MSRLIIALIFSALAHVVIGPRAFGADQKLWEMLQKGSQIILIRHAVTTPGVGDPPGMRLEDCGTQRNLTDAGRAHARRVGEAFRARAVPIARVLSSPWCRCQETARLAFGQPDVWQALGNLFGREEHRAKQVDQWEELAGQRLHGGNLVLVSHGSTIFAFTGISPDTAEMVIVTPQSDGRFTIVGRLTVP